MPESAFATNDEGLRAQLITIRGTMKTIMFTGIVMILIGAVSGMWIQSTRDGKAIAHTAVGVDARELVKAQPQPMPHPTLAQPAIDSSQLRFQDSQRVAEREYGRAIETLNLNAVVQQTVKGILVDWIEEQISLNIRDAGSRKKDSGPSDYTVERKRAFDRAQSRFAALLDAQRVDQLREMMIDRMNYHMIGYNYSVDFAYAGCPMTPTQVVGLAQVFGMVEAQHRDDPNRGDLLTTVSDSNLGLSVLDVELVQRAALVLNEKQLAVLKENLRIQTTAMVAFKSRGTKPRGVVGGGRTSVIPTQLEAGKTSTKS